LDNLYGEGSFQEDRLKEFFATLITTIFFFYFSTYLLYAHLEGVKLAEAGLKQMQHQVMLVGLRRPLYKSQGEF